MKFTTQNLPYLYLATLLTDQTGLIKFGTLITMFNFFNKLPERKGRGMMGGRGACQPPNFLNFISWTHTFDCKFTKFQDLYENLDLRTSIPLRKFRLIQGKNMRHILPKNCWTKFHEILFVFLYESMRRRHPSRFTIFFRHMV